MPSGCIPPGFENCIVMPLVGNLSDDNDAGAIDRTQSHDMAGIGDSGVEYSPLRHRVMLSISKYFHLAEVWNREVTILTGYRLARETGQSHHEAIDTAIDMNGKINFDPTNTNRPRHLQGDAAKLVAVFQSYQLNTWYRIFRDLHQSFKGETPQARREARYQLSGILGMMGLLSGVSGVAGYGVLMAIAGIPCAAIMAAADVERIIEAVEASSGQIILFIDEIHRFNRAQQDGFLPFVERGTVVLVGATTENPSFALNAALLSRAQVLVLHRLDESALGTLIARAEAEAGQRLPVTDEARMALVASADGDGRFLLNQVETLFSVAISEPLAPAELAQFLHRRMPVYDKDRDGHYNLISALHKAMRGSDPQASLYWLARMLVAGEEPLYTLRRITRFASEDIGLADPQALVQCLAAKDAYQFLGSPEGELAIVQACLYCATAPKSNAAYMAQKAAWAAARETGSLAPPANILNAPTKLMKDLGYGAGYAYDHDAPEGFSGDNYWPDEMRPIDFYRPVDRGFEKRIAERLAWWDERRRGSGLARRGATRHPAAPARRLPR